MFIEYLIVGSKPNKSEPKKGHKPPAPKGRRIEQELLSIFSRLWNSKKKKEEFRAQFDEEIQKILSSTRTEEDMSDFSIAGTPLPDRNNKTCRYCGATELTWVQVDGKWRLFNGGSIHNCPVNPLKYTADTSGN